MTMRLGMALLLAREWVSLDLLRDAKVSVLVFFSILMHIMSPLCVWHIKSHDTTHAHSRACTTMLTNTHMYSFTHVQSHSCINAHTSDYFQNRAQGSSSMWGSNRNNRGNNSGMGFWSGIAAGGALGYLFGNRGNRRGNYGYGNAFGNRGGPAFRLVCV